LHPAKPQKKGWTMTLPNIFDLCKPREDVEKGSISDSDYAANLANVLTGRASRDYTDPPTFFANTYPTEGLKELLVNVCGRLSGSVMVISVEEYQRLSARPERAETAAPRARGAATIGQ
jgi:hypothetical protein